MFASNILEKRIFLFSSSEISCAGLDARGGALGLDGVGLEGVGLEGVGLEGVGLEGAGREGVGLEGAGLGDRSAGLSESSETE
jgi:hypothetical protein